MTALPDVGRRAHVLAMAIGVPVVAAAIACSMLDLGRVLRPGSPWFMTPPASSFADAISSGSPLETYQLLRGGHDPNEPIDVRPAPDGRRRMVSPVMWALVRERDDIVLLLLAFGARLTEEERDVAICLAVRRGNESLVRALSRGAPVPAAPTCGDAAVSGL